MSRNTVTKAVAVVKSVAGTDPNGEFDLILSAATEDRDGEVVEAKAFGDLPDHVSMDMDHAMTCDKTVGSGVPSYEPDGSLRVRGTFAGTADGQKMRTLVDEGHIRTASVAFIRKSTKKVDGKVHITKAELLNGAFTPVPSNRESVVLSSKALAAIEELQTDAAPHRSTKAIVGSVEALQDRVRDALKAAYSYAYLRGVLPNETHDGGTVVFETSRIDTSSYEYQTYSQEFTDDGSVVTLTGTASVVDVHEIVVPDADADRASKALPAAGTAATVKDAAAPTADSPTPDAGVDTDDTSLRLRALAIASAASL